ncbi:prefoldin subunit domain-containing protein [Ditylenchus destructor]|nr:prefoldin subunit domain-containing protein [Ditylenchus destructor]
MSNIKKAASAEDQLEINRFARLHKTYIEVKSELSQLNNETQNIGDAEDEILLLDDEAAASIPFQIGSIFVHFDQDTISTKLAEGKESNAQKIAALQKRLSQLDNELKQLRAVLYAKFGDNIHLEMDEE